MSICSIPNVNQSKNEPTFERCPHDRENPYVQISRELIQDRNISPKAKGVLIYLLSLPRDWKIYHSQLQYGLNIGEDCLNSAMDELIKEGYAERTRERIKGVFQPYRYKIREFKKCLPNRKTPPGELSDLPDRENRPGSSGPENPVIQSRDSSSTKETSTKQDMPAAAFFSPKNEKRETPAIYPSLEHVDIPPDHKLKMTARADEQTVVNAIAWATHPQNPPKESLVQSIWFAINNRLSAAKFEEKKKTPYEMVSQHFKHGTEYNDAICCLTKEAISFQRTLKYAEVRLDKFFTWSKLLDVCKMFGIDFNPQEKQPLTT